MRRITQIKGGAPIGKITPVTGRLAKDEGGRVFVYKSLEQHEAARRFMSYGRDKRNFSFTHIRNIADITRELSNKYCGYLLLLQPNIQFKTGVLVAEGREGAPLTLPQIARIWGVSKRTAAVVIEEFEARSILFGIDGSYVMNDRYHFRNKASGEVDALIKTYFTALKSFNMTAADLGFVYKLLQLVHYETNQICADPFARPEDIRFLSDKEIGEAVGMSETKTKEALARLRKSRIIGEWVSVEDKRKKLTVLNPYVFYRRNGEPDATLRSLFAGTTKK